MADKKIDELIAATEMSDSALLVVYQDGETKSVSGEKVKGYAENAAQDEIGEKFSSMTIVTGEPDTDARYDPETNTMTIPRGKQGAAGAGSGDMIASTYDPQGKAQDIFKYADNAANNAKTVMKTVALPASGWSAGSGGYAYEQTVAVSGETITASTSFDYDVSLSGTDAAASVLARDAFALILLAESVSGGIRFACPEKKPDINLSVIVRIYR